MLIDAAGKPIGATPEDAAAIIVQTVAAKAREVLAALDMIGVKVPLPLEIRAGNQVAVLGREGVKLEKVADGKPKKERAPRNLNGNGNSTPAPVPTPAPVSADPASGPGSVFDRRSGGAAALISQDGSATVAAGVLAGLAEATPPSFP